MTDEQLISKVRERLGLKSESEKRELTKRQMVNLRKNSRDLISVIKTIGGIPN